MDYKKDNNDNFFNSASSLDDIDEFFLKNFNVLLDDNKLTDVVSNDLETINNQTEEKEILDIDDIEILDDKEKIEFLDDIDLNIENERPEILDINIKEEVEILDDIIFNDTKETEVNHLEESNNLNIFYGIKDIEGNNEFLNKEVETLDNNTNQYKIKKIVNKKKLILIILLIILLTGLTFVIYKIVRWKLDNDSISSQIKDVQNSVVIEDVQDNENTIIIEPDDETVITDAYYDFIKVPLMNVDINNLRDQNSDIVGWLKVNGTNINYPIVQTNDNKYYLNHSFDKSYNEGGWVFADYRNNFINDKNLIIYAHARLDKTMFGTLMNTTNASWYTNTDNHLIKLSTLNSNTSWQVFSTYIIPSEDYYITTEFSSNSEYLEFLNTLKNRSVYNYGVSVNENDRILTLSTCHGTGKKAVLHAKLIKIENR